MILRQLLQLGLLLSTAHAGLVLSEIMWAAPNGPDFNFLEFYNDGPLTLDLNGYFLAGAILYSFPAYTILPYGTVVLAQNPAKLKVYYPNANPNSILGPWSGNLTDAGRQIALVDSSGQTIHDFAFPIRALSSDFGCSLQPFCFTWDYADPNNWFDSTLTRNFDPNEEPGGSAGFLDDWQQSCPPPNWTLTTSPNLPLVLFSVPLPILGTQLTRAEVMYHPVEVDSLDQNEFVEFYNAENYTVDLSGWRFAASRGLARFDFPAISILPRSYLVIAKDSVRLLTTYASVGVNIPIADANGGAGLWAAQYDRYLGNGGDFLVLLDANQRLVDSLHYNDKFPWPIGADGMGASDEFRARASDLADLTNTTFPRNTLLYRGLSLQRFGWNRQVYPADSPATWGVSFPTPGSAFPELRALNQGPPPIIIDIDLAPKKRDIRAGNAVVIEFEFDPPTAVITGAQVLWWVQDPARDLPPIETKVVNTTNAIAVPGKQGFWSVTIPGQAVNRVVKYQIRALSGSDFIRSPRVNDPFSYWAYFVGPQINTPSVVYQFFIRPDRQEQLWDNIQDARISGCDISPTWNGQEFGVLVWEGDVIDVKMRYQGNTGGRRTGAAVPAYPTWCPQPGVYPSGTFLALSYRFKLPPYASIDGKGIILLHKVDRNTNGCPFLGGPVMYRTMEEMNQPAPENQFARLYLNGCYFKYVWEIEHPTDRMITRFNQHVTRLCPHQRSEYDDPQNFKARALPTYGYSMHKLFQPESICGINGSTRYGLMYLRETYDDVAKYLQEDLILTEIRELQQQIFSVLPTDADGRLIEPNGGSVARQSARNLVQSWIQLEMYLIHFAITTFAAAGDDWAHNYLMQAFHRIGDASLDPRYRKWMRIPWDSDCMYGGCWGSDINAPAWPYNRDPWTNGYTGDSWHREKDLIYKLFPSEFRKTLAWLVKFGPLRREALQAKMDAVYAEWNHTEAMSAWVPLSWNNDALCYQAGTTFITQRHQFLINWLGADYTNCNITDLPAVCPDKPTLTKLRKVYRNPPGPALAPWFLSASRDTLAFGCTSPHPNNLPILSIKFFYRPQGQTSSPQTQTVPFSSQLTLTGLSSNTNYEIWVTAVNQAGESTRSPSIYAQTNSAPNQPVPAPAAATAGGCCLAGLCANQGIPVTQAQCESAGGLYAGDGNVGCLGFCVFAPAPYPAPAPALPPPPIRLCSDFWVCDSGMSLRANANCIGPCSDSQCCQATCLSTEHVCGAGFAPKSALAQQSQPCPASGCTDTNCCLPATNPTCAGNFNFSLCPSPSNETSLPTATCASTSCTMDDCCRPPTCLYGICPEAVFRSLATHCPFDGCTPARCCVPATCDSAGPACSAGYQTVIHASSTYCNLTAGCDEATCCRVAPPPPLPSPPPISLPSSPPSASLASAPASQTSDAASNGTGDVNAGPSFRLFP